MRRAALVLVLAIAAIGCRTGYGSKIVLGPYDADPPNELWERTLAAVRAARYEPTLADAARGQIVVPSRTFGSREQILVQLYREGWIQVSLYGDGSFPMWRGVHPDLRREHEELCLALQDVETEPEEPEE